ncbi:hypothetical protein TI39_contig348g00022 [Zymoseptoria brevis]|uniref:Uncharacterized protein n=1 Tax=Zymoseptoria brevis TaxID=1047168 RepID=A0A0F4GRL2_9PEZI|nr:hypothetical protein TI39_contig348g00022 [Zymoseptoria brevis]
MASSKVTFNDLNVNTVITDMAAHVHTDNKSGDSNQKSNAADTTGENDKTVNSDAHTGTTDTTAIMSNGSNVAVHEPDSLMIHINNFSSDGVNNTKGNTVNNTDANSPSPHDSPRSHSNTTTPPNSGHTHEFVVPSSSRTVPTTSPSYGPSPTGIHPNGASSSRTAPGSIYVPPLSSRRNSKASIHRRTPSTPTPVVAASSRSPLQSRSSSTNAYPSRAQIARQERGDTPRPVNHDRPTRAHTEQKAREREAARALASAANSSPPTVEGTLPDLSHAADLDVGRANYIRREDDHEEVCLGGFMLACIFEGISADPDATGADYEQQNRLGLTYQECRQSYYAELQEKTRMAMAQETLCLAQMQGRREARIVGVGQRTKEGFLNDESADEAEAEMVMEQQPRPKQREAPVVVPPKAKRQKATAKPKSKATAKASSSKPTGKGKGKGKAAVRG